MVDRISRGVTVSTERAAAVADGLRNVGAAMPQHLADLCQRQSLPQHVHGKRMAQLMRPGDVHLDSGAPDRPTDDLADVAVRPQPVEGRPRAQEDPAARRFRSPVLQVECDRLADLVRQGQRPLKDAGVTFDLDYNLTENWGLTGRLGYKRLLGDAADSPLVEDRGSADQLSTGLFVNYKF